MDPLSIYNDSAYRQLCQYPRVIADSRVNFFLQFSLSIIMTGISFADSLLESIRLYGLVSGGTK